MPTLSGKTAFITGGTSGIGLAVARSFVEEGANVMITGRRSEGSEIASEAGCTFLPCDVSKEDDVVRALEETTAQFGKLDIVIANAGIAADTEGLVATPTSVMRDIVETNIMGVYYTLKHAPAHMNDGGSIITTGSAAGSGITTFASGEYAASKAAAAYLTRTMAIELAERGIRANVIAPAAIAGTGMMTEDDGGPDAVFYSTLTSLGRLGKQEEVASLYVYLASDASAFITGQELRVDGGMTAGISGPITALIAEKAEASGSD